jgi:two-component system, NtrC family, nitrogen regulation sensor histidine kinase NtrY
VKNKSLRNLHTSLNRINKVISEIKIKQAHNEKFFLEFMKRSATGLMAVDDQDYVEIINDAALRLIGLAHISHLRRLQQQHTELYSAMLHLKTGHTRIIKLIHGQELRQVSIKVAYFTFGAKQYGIFSIYDIRAEMEENELETWQKLIRIMTHEIMNSIAPITSISKTLSKFYISDESRKTVETLSQTEIDNTIQGLAVIEDRAQGLLHFVDNYRKLTKIPKPVFKPIDIDEWLDCILLLFQNRMECGNIAVELVKKYPKKEFPGDVKLLTQVVLNLLNNAADALENIEEKKIVIATSESKSGTLKLEILDNGKGFGNEELDKIFMPFYTTKENGSGIGLSLSRQIMRLHKGSIMAHSNPGKRTVFEMKF